MAFKIPSISEFRDVIVALGRSLLPDLAFGSRRSFHGKMATFQAGATTILHSHIASAQRDLHPLTAGEGKPIEDWCFATGVIPKGATGARKAQAGRVRGAAGATVNPGRQLRNPQTGLLFEIANTTTITIPGVAGVDPDGFFDADIAGVSTGSQTRLAAGETLNFLSDPVGIQSEVTLQLDLDEDGFDQEQFGSIRQRFLSTFSSTPSGGSQPEFARWAVEALPSVSTAFVYPNRAGLGTVDVAAFYSGDARSLTLPDREAVADYIRSKAPFHIAGEGGSLRVILTVEDQQIVEVSLRPETLAAYKFDWIGPAAVAGWTPLTRQLQFSAPLPLSLRAGHRLVLVGTPGGSGVLAQDGREYKVQSISGSDTVILEKTPPNAPAAGDIIHSGGPLVAPVRGALLGHLKGETVYAGRGQVPIPASKTDKVTGLDILASGIGPANPNGKYGPWSGDIVRATLYKIAMYKGGVANVGIVNPPLADYQASDDPFPNDGQIHYIVPSAVIVRSI